MSQVSSLNEKQQEAIDARNRNILVSAPAGSGKTKILVSRILALLKEGVSIEAFLVLTFCPCNYKFFLHFRSYGYLQYLICQSRIEESY